MLWKAIAARVHTVNTADTVRHSIFSKKFYVYVIEQKLKIHTFKVRALRVFTYFGFEHFMEALSGSSVNVSWISFARLTASGRTQPITPIACSKTTIKHDA